MAEAKFVQGNLFRHIMVMSLTSSVGLMAVFVVDLINMAYISWLGRSELAAAVGYAGAVLFFTTSFGIGLSIAVSALVSRAIGQGDLRLAREKATTGMMLGLVFGVPFAGLVWLLLSPMVTLLGAKGETHDLAVHFLQIVTIGQPMLMLGMIGSAILRAHGDAKAAMMATVWGAVVTAALDPVLIFGFGMDLTGAALTGLVSRAVILFMALRPIFTRYGGLDRPTLRGIFHDMGPVWAIGIPAILTQVATPVGQAFVTRAASGFGEAAVAGMAIAGRLTPVAFGVIFALAGAIGPIIGQNIGAGRMDRVARAFRDALIFTALVIVTVSAALFLLRAPIADLFNAEGLTREIVYLFCGPLALMWFFNGVIFAGNAVCNNLGRPFWSTVVNWGRHTIGTMPFAIWFGQLWGAKGVLIGQSVGGIVFALLAVIFARLAIARPNLTTGVARAEPVALSQPEAEATAPGERRA